MGYNLRLRLEVTPRAHFAAVKSAIREQFGKQFDENGDGDVFGSDWCYDTRWNNLTKDMIALSKGFPDTRITIYGEGEDHQVWMEYFHDGKYRIEIRPEWEVPAWDEDKMGAFPYKPVEQAKKFTVILNYPDSTGYPTWMTHVHGEDVPEAMLKARTEFMATLNDGVDPKDIYAVAVIAGHHKDLS